MKKSRALRSQLKTLEQLTFNVNMDASDVREMTEHGRRRAELCVPEAGAAVVDFFLVVLSGARPFYA